MIKMSLNKIASLMDCNSTEQIVIEGVAVDSRNVQPKNLFFALEGENTDGHNFIKQAVDKGAAAAVVRHDYSGLDHGLPLIRVNSGLESLQKLTQNFLKEKKLPIVAITGSVGKTTTKDFTAQLLKQHYSVAFTQGNSNSQIGLPLTVLNQLKEDDDCLVLEMGMTHPGQIAGLTAIAPPKIALITSVALVHACNFSSLEEIAEAKGEIFSHSKTEWGIFPEDLPFAEKIKHIGTCRKQTFSVASKGADFFMEELPDCHLRIHALKEIADLANFLIPGKHNRHNLLAAVSVAKLMGLSWEEIREAVGKMKLPEKRLQFEEHRGIVFINDTYNASVLSVKAALESMPESPAGKKIAVLGDMLELGKFSRKCHEEIGIAAVQSVDLLFCLGTESLATVEAWKQFKEGAYWFSERGKLVDALKNISRPGDVVLVKGSRGMQMGKVIEDFCL